MKGIVPEPADLMRLQADAINQAAQRLDSEEFGRAVKLLSDVRGKVVVSGAGTSGILARKLAATLTSTGTPALFLHPSDALHGALGIVTSDDAAVLFSNSGETDELLALVPYLQHREVGIVAIVGNVRSTLAGHAAVVLDAIAERESCPLNLAPTTSTSVALAVADALAMTVMRAKNVTLEGFARNHPSGRLGKRLTLRVDALVHRGPSRPVVAVDASLTEIVTTMSVAGLGAATVEDDEQHLLGIITDGDLRRAVQRVDPSELPGLRALDVMSADPVTVRTGVLAYDALQLMENRPSQISVLPVLDEHDRCIGLVRVHDLVRSGV